MVSQEGVELAKRLGVDMDHYNFAKTDSFEPVVSNVPGIYVCGAFQAPKDIPASVVDSSAAAGLVGSRLAESRWTLTKTREIPDEVDVRGEPPRVGVFVCRCSRRGGICKDPARCCLRGGKYVQLLPGHSGENDRGHQRASAEPGGCCRLHTQNARTAVSRDVNQRRCQ
ncbi:MAG: hypothetical protein JRF39_09225 [Deltaproteobacteria bacterium]|nr:hypothetical protein [Deltaproteobacteria bacterium]